MIDDVNRVLRSDLATREPGRAFGRALNTWFVQVGPTAIYKTCATCQFMKRVGPAFCEKANMTPPVAIIMTGCEEYRDELLAGRPGYRASMEHFRENSASNTYDDDIPF